MQVLNKRTEGKYRYLTIQFDSGKVREYYSAKVGWVSIEGIDCSASFDKDLNKAWKG